MDLPETFLRLAVALGVGLIVGVDRDRHERLTESAPRISGVRTFALISLSGALAALVAHELMASGAQAAAAIVIAAALIANAAPILVMRALVAARREDYGATTIIATQAVFAISILAILGDVTAAAAAGAACAFILWAKKPLHSLTRALTDREIAAALRFLGMTTILLPLLPNRPMGPYDALNPFEIGFMVAALSGVSFLGYAALRLSGHSRYGLLLAAAAGGFVSSTAVTLSYARRARHIPHRTNALAAGVGLAGVAMWTRMMAVAAVAAPAAGPEVAMLLAPPALVGAATAWLLWRRTSDTAGQDATVNPGYPFDLSLALKFTALLVIVSIAVKALLSQTGGAGLFGLAFATGLADVDAATLSFSRSAARGELSTSLTAAVILVVGISDTFTKSMIALFMAPGAAGRKIALSLLASLVAALATLAAAQILRT